MTNEHTDGDGSDPGVMALLAALDYIPDRYTTGPMTRTLDGIENYLKIRGDSLSARQAAIRLRCSSRTIVRYRRLLRLARHN